MSVTNKDSEYANIEALISQSINRFPWESTFQKVGFPYGSNNIKENVDESYIEKKEEEVANLLLYIGVSHKFLKNQDTQFNTPLQSLMEKGYLNVEEESLFNDYQLNDMNLSFQNLLHDIYTLPRDTDLKIEMDPITNITFSKLICPAESLKQLHALKQQLPQDIKPSKELGIQVHDIPRELILTLWINQVRRFKLTNTNADITKTKKMNLILNANIHSMTAKFSGEKALFTWLTDETIILEDVIQFIPFDKVFSSQEQGLSTQEMFNQYDKNLNNILSLELREQIVQNTLKPSETMKESSISFKRYTLDGDLQSNTEYFKELNATLFALVFRFYKDILAAFYLPSQSNHFVNNSNCFVTPMRKEEKNNIVSNSFDKPPFKLSEFEDFENLDIIYSVNSLVQLICTYMIETHAVLTVIKHVLDKNNTEIIAFSLWNFIKVTHKHRQSLVEKGILDLRSKEPASIYIFAQGDSTVLNSKVQKFREISLWLNLQKFFGKEIVNIKTQTPLFKSPRKNSPKKKPSSVNTNKTDQSDLPFWITITNNNKNSYVYVNAIHLLEKNTDLDQNDELCKVHGRQSKTATNQPEFQKRYDLKQLSGNQYEFNTSPLVTKKPTISSDEDIINFTISTKEDNVKIFQEMKSTSNTGDQFFKLKELSPGEVSINMRMLNLTSTSNKHTELSINDNPYTYNWELLNQCLNLSYILLFGNSEIDPFVFLKNFLSEIKSNDVHTQITSLYKGLIRKETKYIISHIQYQQELYYLKNPHPFSNWLQLIPPRNQGKVFYIPLHTKVVEAHSLSESFSIPPTITNNLQLFPSEKKALSTFYALFSLLSPGFKFDHTAKIKDLHDTYIKENNESNDNIEFVKLFLYRHHQFVLCKTFEKFTKSYEKKMWETIYNTISTFSVRSPSAPITPSVKSSKTASTTTSTPTSSSTATSTSTTSTPPSPSSSRQLPGSNTKPTSITTLIDSHTQLSTLYHQKWLQILFADTGKYGTSSEVETSMHSLMQNIWELIYILLCKPHNAILDKNDYEVFLRKKLNIFPSLGNSIQLICNTFGLNSHFVTSLKSISQELDKHQNSISVPSFMYSYFVYQGDEYHETLTSSLPIEIKFPLIDTLEKKCLNNFIDFEVDSDVLKSPNGLQLKTLSDSEYDYKFVKMGGIFKLSSCVKLMEMYLTYYLNHFPMFAKSRTQNMENLFQCYDLARKLVNYIIFDKIDFESCFDWLSQDINREYNFLEMNRNKKLIPLVEKLNDLTLSKGSGAASPIWKKLTNQNSIKMSVILTALENNRKSFNTDINEDDLNYFRVFKLKQETIVKNMEKLLFTFPVHFRLYQRLSTHTFWEKNQDNNSDNNISTQFSNGIITIMALALSVMNTSISYPGQYIINSDKPFMLDIGQHKFGTLLVGILNVKDNNVNISTENFDFLSNISPSIRLLQKYLKTIPNPDKADERKQRENSTALNVWWQYVSRLTTTFDEVNKGENFILLYTFVYYILSAITISFVEDKMKTKLPKGLVLDTWLRNTTTFQFGKEGEGEGEKETTNSYLFWEALSNPFVFERTSFTKAKQILDKMSQLKEKNQVASKLYQTTWTGKELIKYLDNLYLTIKLYEMNKI
jgi:hypothetical protein